MPISIDWSTNVINVPQSYLTHVSGALYELDVNQFRLDLKDIEDSAEGMVFPDTHRHNTEVVLGGVTYARFVEVLSPYTITFEDGIYAVRLVGANNNVADVANVNSVSIRTANSAGLVTVSSGSGLSTEEHDKLMAVPSETLTTEEHNALLAVPAVGEIADAVWDEPAAQHTSTGTMGAKLNAASAGGVDLDALANAVWEEDLSTHSTAGTAGDKLDGIPSGSGQQKPTIKIGPVSIPL